MNILEVTKEEFFKVIGPQNIHPYPITGNLKRSEWKRPNGQLVGVTEDNIIYPSCENKGKYWLVKENQ